MRELDKQRKIEDKVGSTYCELSRSERCRPSSSSEEEESASTPSEVPGRVEFASDVVVSQP
jgi:hypothetical protein